MPRAEFESDMRYYPRFWQAYMALADSQSQRARRLGLTQRAVGLWEVGGRMPTFYSLRNWPAGLRILADDLEAQANGEL